MYTIRIAVRCPAVCAEVLPGDLESAARVIEERMSLLLLEIFTTVLVDAVSVVYDPSHQADSATTVAA